MNQSVIISMVWNTITFHHGEEAHRHTLSVIILAHRLEEYPSHHGP